MHRVRVRLGEDRGYAGVEQRGGAWADVPAQDHRGATVWATREHLCEAVRHESRVAAKGPADFRRRISRCNQRCEDGRIGRPLCSTSLVMEVQERFLGVGRAGENVVGRSLGARGANDTGSPGHDCRGADTCYVPGHERLLCGLQLRQLTVDAHVVA